MTTVVIVSRDADLRSRVASRTAAGSVTWIDGCDALEQALTLPIHRALVDLNVRWEQDITLCIRRLHDDVRVPDIVAFLHERSGDIAIRAHLAGAHRVIPQNQLEAELETLLGA